ncbi:glucokinase, partial [Modicella reniformis]
MTSLLPETRFEWSIAQCKALEFVASELTITSSKLENLAHHFVSQMREGLSKEQPTDLAMIPTFVTGRPTGHERGCYLALDLGGTNLR